MAKKKKKDDSNLVGRIITLLFVLILVAGGYGLFSMFRQVEITEENLAGEWKLPGSPVVYYQFGTDGTASSYEKYTGTGNVANQREYRYELVDNVIILEWVDEDRVEEIKVTGLSYAQLSVIMNASEMKSLTRENMF